MSILARPATDGVPTILATTLDGRERPVRRVRPSLPRPARAARASAACARTATAGCCAARTAPWSRPGSTRSRRSRCSTSIPGSLAYSIATAGCPFHCRFCQNWEIAQAPRLGLEIPSRRMSPADVVREARRSGAASVAYTYVEPTVFLEYALDTGPARARGRAAQPVHHRRVRHARGDRPARRRARRRERRPQELRRRLLPPAVRRPARPRARGDRRDAPGRDLAGAHDARHPRPQRLGRRARGPRPLDRRDAGAGRRRGT